MISAERYGPWAVIAGGSEGIGASFARKLSRAGINLVLIARHAGPLNQLASTLRSETGAQVRTLELDLSRPDMLERVREVTDELDVGLLIYNAADIGSFGPFLESSLERALGWVQLIAVGQTTLAHHFASKMAKRGHGGILMLGSLTGNAGSVNLASYGASKAFTQILGEALWQELKPHGIDVLVLVVGAADTPARARSGAHNPMGLRPSDEVAQLGLDNLTNGPVCLMPTISHIFRRLCSSPRREAIGMMSGSVAFDDPE